MAASLTNNNLSTVAAGAGAVSALAGLILVTPNISATQGYQPLNPPSAITLLPQPLPPSFVFNYEGENAVRLSSDITDHYVEDNTPIQDNIALKPEEITVTGYVGELTNILPSYLQPLQTAANVLVAVDAYAPAVSVTALLALNEATLAYEQVASAATSAVSAFASLVQPLGFGAGSEVVPGSGVFQEGSSFIQSNQQQMFTQIYGYWVNKILFNVQTPWAVFTDMAIKDMESVQDEETRMISTFKITFKKIRTASTQIDDLSILSAGRAATASSPPTNLGTSSGVEDNSTLGGNVSGV